MGSEWDPRSPLLAAPSDLVTGCQIPDGLAEVGYLLRRRSARKTVRQDCIQVLAVELREHLDQRLDPPLSPARIGRRRHILGLRGALNAHPRPAAVAGQKPIQRYPVLIGDL